MSIEIGTTPIEYSISQNYPNPFNPSTIIKYSIPFESYVIIKFYNCLGESVREIDAGTRGPGYYKLSFNASGLSSGIYFYTIQANSIDGKQNFKNTKKMILMKWVLSIIELKTKQPNGLLKNPLGCTWRKKY